MAAQTQMIEPQKSPTVRVGCGHVGAYGRFVKAKGGRWKAGTPMRCSRCHRRLTTKKAPHDDRWPKCCGLRMRVDHYRRSGAENKRQVCDCGGYPFTHRKGSLFCDHGRAAPAGFGFIRGQEEEQAFLDWRASERSDTFH